MSEGMRVYMIVVRWGINGMDDGWVWIVLSVGCFFVRVSEDEGGGECWGS